MVSVRRIAGYHLFLFCALCFTALFNLDTSPFRFIVPASPFSECPDNMFKHDTYIYLYTGNLIPQGLMPYRDSFDHKGPLFYLIIASGLRMWNVAGLWLVQTFLLFVSGFFAYKTARLLVSPWPSAFAAATALMWAALCHTSPETVSIPFLLVSLHCLVRYLLNGYRISGWETVLAGACFGAVLLIKANLVTLWIVFILTVTVASAVRKEFLRLTEMAALFVSGAAGVVLPILCWLYVKGAFPDFVEDYWVFNFQGYGGEPSFRNYLGFFLPLNGAVIWYRYLWFNTPALAVYLFLVFREKDSVKRNLYLVMTAYFALSILLLGIRGTFWDYYAFPLAAAYLVFFAVSFETIGRIRLKHTAFALILFLLLAAPALRSLFIPALQDWGKRCYLRHFAPQIDLAHFGVPLRDDRDALELAEWIRENVPEKATINGVEARVYWYAKRRHAAVYSLPPAQQSYDDTFVRDENGNYPDYILERRIHFYSPGDVLRSVPKEKFETSPEIEKTLAEDYEQVFRNEGFDFYKRKGTAR